MIKILMEGGITSNLLNIFYQTEMTSFIFFLKTGIYKYEKRFKKCDLCK